MTMIVAGMVVGMPVIRGVMPAHMAVTVGNAIE
jgi:hypothetical protein